MLGSNAVQQLKEPRLQREMAGKIQDESVVVTKYKTCTCTYVGMSGSTGGN
jgi:hypothetical protein